MNGLVRWLRTTFFGVSRGEVLFTSLLSLYAVVLVATQSTAGACLAALGMVVPVAFARRAPLAASVTIAVATLANELLFRASGPMWPSAARRVLCGLHSWPSGDWGSPAGRLGLAAGRRCLAMRRRPPAWGGPARVDGVGHRAVLRRWPRRAVALVPGGGTARAQP